MKNIYVNSPPSIVEWSYQFGSSKGVFWEVLAKTARYTVAICIAKYFMSYHDRLQTIENYYQLWLHVLLCVRSFIAIVYVFVYHTVHVYLHSFSAWCIYTFILRNIPSPLCACEYSFSAFPCTYSLAVYIYNTWEDIIIYAFCLFVYIERIFLSKKSRQKRLPRINCTKLC